MEPITVKIFALKGTWCDQFHMWLKKFSENTQDSYLRGVTAYMVWFNVEMEEDFEPAKLFGPDVERWKREPANEKPATFNLRLAALRELVKFGLAQHILSNDPLKDVTPKTEQTLAPKWLTKSERGRLLRQVALDVHIEPSMVRNAAAIHLMIYAGLRVSEVEKLLWEDIVIRDRSGYVTVREGKGNKTRTVALNLECRRSLAEYHTYCDDEDPEASVFGATKRTIQRWVEAAAEACGLEGVSAHTLRHTCAKTLVDSGVGLEVVAALLGHSSMETTRRYVTPGLDDLQAAVDRL